MFISAGLEQRTIYEISIQVRDVQPTHTHLSGLTSLFLEKLKLHQRLQGKFLFLIYICGSELDVPRAQVIHVVTVSLSRNLTHLSFSIGYG